MRLFGIKLINISIVFIGILFGVDYLIQEGLKTSNYREVSKWNEVVTGGIDAEILIVGSSRALVHFDCQIIEEITGESCYNLGFDGTNYEIQQKMLKLYLKYNFFPKKLVWIVDFHSFERKNEFYGFEQLVPFQDKSEIRELLSMNTSAPKYFYYLPIIRYNFNPKMKKIGLLNYFNLYSKGPVLVKGYGKRDLQWDSKFEEFMTTSKEGLNYVFDKLLFNDFKNELDLLQYKGASIHLVIAPVYFEAKKLIINSDDVINKSRILSLEKNYIFLDYSSDSINYNKNLFYNGSHLNSAGVELFSKKFALEIEN